MPRSGAQARRRLQDAALELYRERGYDTTTTAEIAARAGVNERTFYRHFADKREVLFGGESRFHEAVVAAITRMPVDLEPFEVVLRALQEAAGDLDQPAHRSFSQARSRVVAVTPALRERELSKGAALTDVLTRALLERGVDPRRAAVAAELGWVLFLRAARAWLDEPPRRLRDHLAEAFDDVRLLAVPRPGTVTTAACTLWEPSASGAP